MVSETVVSGLNKYAIGSKLRRLRLRKSIIAMIVTTRSPGANKTIFDSALATRH